MVGDNAQSYTASGVARGRLAEEPEQRTRPISKEDAEAQRTALVTGVVSIVFGVSSLPLLRPLLSLLKHTAANCRKERKSFHGYPLSLYLQLYSPIIRVPLRSSRGFVEVCVAYL